MGRTVQEFYGSTLREIKNAVDGFEELKTEQYEEYMFGVRKICYSVQLPYVKKGKTLNEEDIFPLNIDKKLKLARLKSMTPIEVIRYDDGK